MAAATLVARLRRRIADTGASPAFSDAELSMLLDEHGGSEPSARLAALQELATEAAKRTDYQVGLSSEKSSQWFAHLGKLLDEARSDAATEAGATEARLRAAEQSTVAVGVQVVF